MPKNRLVFLVLIAVSSLLAYFIFTHISQPQMVVWDESNYLLQTNGLRQTLIERGLGSFLDISRKQIDYPIIQPWYYVIATFFLGISVNSIRLANVLLLIPATIFLWFISNELIAKKNIFKLIPVALFLTSPMIAFYFSNAMKEALGATLTILSLWLYFQARKSSKRIYFFLTSISLLALFLEKYNYCVLLILPLLVENLIWFFNKKPRLFWVFQIYLFVPLAIGLYIWIYTPFDNSSHILQTLQNSGDYNFKDTPVLNHIFHYPLEITFSYLLSSILAIFTLIGFIWSLKEWRDLRIRILFILFMLNLYLTTSHMGNNQGRYIFTSVPALFLLTGVGLKLFFDSFYHKIKRNIKVKWLAIFLLFFISSFIIKDALNFSTRIRSTGSHQIGSAVFYEKDYQNNSRFDFNLSTWPHQFPSKTELSGQTMDDVYNYIFSKTNLNNTYGLLTTLNEFSPGYFEFRLALERQRRKIVAPDISERTNYVLLQIDPKSRFETIDYWKSHYAEIMKNTEISKKFYLIEEKYFPYLGLKVMIFDDRPLQDI